MGNFTKMRYADLVSERNWSAVHVADIFDKPNENRAFTANMLTPLEAPEYRLFLTGSARNGWIVMINKQDRRTDFALRSTR